MFTLKQIDHVHKLFGKQATLPEYLKSLNIIGVDKCDSFISDGHSEYLGKDQKLVSAPVHEKFIIAGKSSQDGLLKYLDLHSQGKIDYIEMSEGLANSGIEKWTFDTKEMTMIYYDKDGKEMLAETIR